MTVNILTIISDIEQAVEDRLKDGGLDARDFDITQDVDNIVCPAANTAFIDGPIERTTMTRQRMNALFATVVIVRNVKSEKDRRRAVYPLVGAVAGLLGNCQLATKNEDGTYTELGCERVKILRVRRVNVSSTERIAYELTFTVSFVFEYPATDEALDVLKIACQYHLKPGDSVADAEDVVEVGS